MSVKKRIVLTPMSNVLAHTGRCLLLARELKRRGHQIVFAGTPKYLRNPTFVASDEFDYYDLIDFNLEEGLDILRSVHKLPSARTLEECVRAELHMLDQVRPDLVVVDFRVTMYIAAAAARIPVVSLVNGHWLYQYANKPYRASRTYKYYPVLKRLLGVRGVEALVAPLQPCIFHYKMLPFRSVFRKYGVPIKRALWDLLVGDLNLVLDTELCSPTANLPDNFRYVGPIFWTPDMPLPEWVSQLDGQRPKLYITMGSTGHLRLFRHLLEAFGDTPYQIIISTGNQIHLSRDDIPQNFYLEPFLPGEQIMELVDVAVHHGGSGTTYQAIRTATPSIVVATHFEQEFQGQALEEHGAGVFLTMLEVLADPRLIATTTEAMLANLGAYERNVRRLQQDLLRYRPVQAAADSIEAFLQAGVC
jgi:MGT family glycosyltransferase